MRVGLVCWCVPASALFVVWLGAVTSIFAQSATCAPGELGCSCAAGLCAGGARCERGYCVRADDTSWAGPTNATASAGGTPKPVLVAHEMTLLGVSMALAVLLVLVYYWFYDRPGARAQGYSRVQDSFADAVDADTDTEF